MTWFESLKYLLASLANGNWHTTSEGIYVPPKLQLPAVRDTITKPMLNIAIDSSYSWKGIVWHHSATKDDPVSKNWDGIVKYHTSYRIDGVIVTKEEFERLKKEGKGHLFEPPWQAVGYHGGVESEDNRLIFRWGRPLSMAGAHAAVAKVSNEFNKTHIGLCAIGNFDSTVPSAELWEYCLSLTRAFMSAYNIEAADVIGHREVFDLLSVPQQKSCPGDLWSMDLFRSQL